MLNYLRNGRCSSQSYLCIQPSLQSPPKFGFSTLDNFHLPIPPLLVCKIILTIPTKTRFPYTSTTFRPQKVCTNIFCPPQPSSQYRLCHGPRENCHGPRKNCFQNMNCFSWIKLIPVLISSLKQS